MSKIPVYSSTVIKCSFSELEVAVEDFYREEHADFLNLRTLITIDAGP